LDKVCFDEKKAMQKVDSIVSLCSIATRRAEPFSCRASPFASGGQTYVLENMIVVEIFPLALKIGARLANAGH
jgi:hypothetical protein